MKLGERTKNQVWATPWNIVGNALHIIICGTLQRSIIALKNSKCLKGFKVQWYISIKNNQDLTESGVSRISGIKVEKFDSDILDVNVS